MKFVEAEIRVNSTYFWIESGRIFNAKIFGCCFSGDFVCGFMMFADLWGEIFFGIESSFRRNYT